MRRVSGCGRAAGTWRGTWFAALVVGPGLAQAAVPALIPVPASIESADGRFRIFPTTPIAVDSGDLGARSASDLLKHALGELFPKSLCVTAARAQPGAARGRPIRLHRHPGFAPEGYALEVTPQGATITASSDAGLFYGAVTLSQMIPDRSTARRPGGCRDDRAEASGEVQAVKIRDEPRYPWRGLMLDSARHLQSPEFIRNLLDAMAGYKLNVLHWHLTDDQGWRLEIRRYPRLTEVGAYRVPAGRAAARDLDPATGQPRRYGGYYTQATVRELVSYAAARHIMVIPEIDMPGHAAAALAAYPELGVAPAQLGAVPADWGIYPYVFNAEEPTIQFLENVLAEVVELFPAPFVHIGGDEVVTKEWDESPVAQARARELGLKSPAGLHGYLVQRIGRFLAARGRRLTGWDEIIEPGLSPDATIISWRGLDGAVAAARRGNDTVLSPWPALYLDFRQSDAADEPPGRIQVASLGGVYAFEPQPPGLSEAEARHVLGVQVNLWTEHVRSDARAAHAIFPRAAALAEVAWSPAAKRSWPDFLARLARSAARRSFLGAAPPYGAYLVPPTERADQREVLTPADSEFEVHAVSQPASPGHVRVELSTAAGIGEIQYAVHEPAAQDSWVRYLQPLELALPVTLSARTRLDGATIGAFRHFEFTAASERRRTSAELERCSDGIGLALEADAPEGAPRPRLWLDVMNPCWIYRGADLSDGPALTASVGALPFNYQIGDDVRKIRVGDAATPAGELEVRIDGCETTPVLRLPLAAVADKLGVATLDAARLPARAGKHDLCLRFARPRLDPMWALDWVQLGP